MVEGLHAPSGRALAPVVDLEPWWRGDATARAEVAAAVHAACTTTGFFQVVGHGIDASVCEGILEAASTFFSLSNETKARCRPTDGAYRGWIPRKTEGFAATLAKTTPADLVEGFVVGAADRAGANPGDPAFAPNLWPSAEVEVAFTAYYRAARALSEELLILAELALEVEVGTLTAMVDHANVTLRANAYAVTDADGPLEEAQMALGAHTDYGLLTLLLADPGPGLEVLDRDGSWCPLEPFPGALLVNVGDALALFTNDAWQSTIHRVVPTRPVGAPPRRSIALFQDGNPEATVACHPRFVEDRRPARYVPTTLGAHVAAKVASSRTGTTTTATQTTAGRLG